jgi:hypothetical protein
MNRLFSWFLRALLLVSTMLLMSCAAQKERVQAPVTLPERTVEEISCEEVTSKSTNLSGIDSMPFMRMSFYDNAGSGRQDMVIGNKNGDIYLYRNSGDPARHRWQQVYGYFGNVRAGAVSSPVLADLDGDGKAELLVGTGGFSSESGMIVLYSNAGSADSPDWKRTGAIGSPVGKDAAITVVDYNFDGKPDVIAGNSEGKLFFFRNISSGNGIKFVRDHHPPVKAGFGMYAVPAAVKTGNKVILVVGNNMGKLAMYEIRKNGAHNRPMGIRTSSFASPAFTRALDRNRIDLVVADGDGTFNYYENHNGDFSSLRKRWTIFSHRLFAGPVCSPTVCTIGNKKHLVVGNMDGNLRLFERVESAEGVPWAENTSYFHGVRVEGFSRGIVTEWEGRELLITGQGNGRIRAFLNRSSGWKEQHNFFTGVKVREHSTPVIFDSEGNGKWTLITGSGSGRIYAFGIREIRHGVPVWERIEGVFDNIRADGFSTPAIVKDDKAVYLFVGQRDGRIRGYRAEAQGKVNFGALRFAETGFLPDIRMNEHSSPFVQLKNGVFDILSGDYSGNLRHFHCRNTAY